MVFFFAGTEEKDDFLDFDRKILTDLIEAGYKERDLVNKFVSKKSH